MAPTGFEILATSIGTVGVAIAGVIGVAFRQQVKKSNGNNSDHDLLIRISQDVKHLKDGQVAGQESRSEIRDLLITHISDHNVHT